MTLLSTAMARDVARSAPDVAHAIASRPEAERWVSALVAFAEAGADVPAPRWTGPALDNGPLDAIVRVTAGWPEARRTEASAWQLVVSAVRLTVARAGPHAAG